MARMIVGGLLALLFFFVVVAALTGPPHPLPGETVAGAFILSLAAGITLFYFGRRARMRRRQESGPSHLKAICGRCKRPLEREPYGFSDPIQRMTGGCFLGTVCTSCRWVECYRGRGTVGAPCCSQCRGSVSPAYERLFA